MTVLRTSSSVSAEIGSVHLTQEGKVALTSRGNLFRFFLVLFLDLVGIMLLKYLVKLRILRAKFRVRIGMTGM